MRLTVPMFLYEDDAILYIGDNEILFKWDDETSSIFSELLAILAQSQKELAKN